MEPSSTFDVREDGEVQIEGSLDGADGVYITREPEGGSEAPTEPDPHGRRAVLTLVCAARTSK